MFCRYCGAQIPGDSLFCLKCGRRTAALDGSPAPEDRPAPEERPGFETRQFAFPSRTTYDQASVPVNEWLAGQGIRILDARFEIEPELLAGALVPDVLRIELDLVPEETEKRYQLGVMLDSRSDFGLRRKKDGDHLQRQFDRWQREHPDLETAGKQDHHMSMGWASSWVTLFFYR